MMEKVTVDPKVVLKNLDVACANTATLEENKAAYASFKKFIDRFSEENNEAAREIYWKNKARINGVIY